MGRPEPCVLFAQTFVHPQLDEYVDEVIFGESIVITACEFLEQNASSASSAVTLLGATSPPSFALEVFVQCEGETRFRRLCQSFLYSHSSSNVLEVEAVVTNHLVVRGSYRSLSLIIYGNTAEDLGQFNVEFDLDSSLNNLSSSEEAKLEDLPPLLRQRNLLFGESLFSSKALSSLLPVSNIPTEMRQFLQLIFKIWHVPDFGDLAHIVVGTVASAASSFFINDLAASGINLKQFNSDERINNQEPYSVFIQAQKNILDHYREFSEKRCISHEYLSDCTSFESESDLAASKQLVDRLFEHFQCDKDTANVGHGELLKSRNMVIWLSLALLLCSGRESCFHFVNGGGMELLTAFLSNEIHSSTAVTLVLLGVVEQATRYSVGCEGFLGWWPREDETVPSGASEGYSQLLKLLMQKQRHDVASLTSYILHRLRFYEVASRFEHGVLSLLGGLSGARRVRSSMLKLLASTRLQLKKILKLINPFGPVEDPSAVACAGRSMILRHAEGILSYKATSKLIASSSCRFLSQDIDSKLLSLLKERGVLPLSIAMFSSSKLRVEVGNALEVFLDVTSSIGSIILSLLFCRSGLVFLLHHPELSCTIVQALQGTDNMYKEDCMPLRYAFMLYSKGFFCHPQEVGRNVEMHMRVVNAIDHLLTSAQHSEEFLWVLWELCSLSRSDCGRQALLALAHFPEAIKVLIEALHSAKELEAVSLKSGTPLNLAIFHSVAEIFEIIVTDPTSFALDSWIEHATALHKALHSSSPGSNRKDAPTRLLEWIDAGVVYHKNGAVGLLRYAAVLASGGDAHITSTNILVSDSMDVERVVADPSDTPEFDVVENLLGKLVSEKSFDGVTLRDSSVVQLTTALRILAFISENLDVAAALYDEGAVTVIYVVLVNCRLMLERSSNNYADYLVDDGTESNSTSDLLLERNREKCLIDLIIPSLLLLIELLRKLKDAKEQHRNTKLMNALLQLHREISPKLAACAADLSFSYPECALGLETVCHLVASALAFWPAHAWAPGLFHTLLDSVQATSLLTLGPKEACSLLCLLNDLFPEEGVRQWKNGMPLLTAVRSLAVGTVLGTQKERQINWYLQPKHVELVVCQLSPHLDKIAQVILRYTVSTLAVIQDMIRVFIIRLACQKAENASVLLQPIISWIRGHLPEPSSPADMDTYKVYKLLAFLSSLLEHPLAKPLLLKEGIVHVLMEVLQRCVDATGNQVTEMSSAQFGFDPSCCCLPILRSLSLICDSRSAADLPGAYDRNNTLSTEDSLLIFHHLFKLLQVLPVGKELLACVIAFKELASRAEGQKALLEGFLHIKSKIINENQPERSRETHGVFSSLNDVEWKKFPLLSCWISLYRSIEMDGLSTFAIEAVDALCLGALKFCVDGKSLNDDRISALKYFFGLSGDLSGQNGPSEVNVKYVDEMSTLLGSKISVNEYPAESHTNANLQQVVESTKWLSFLLQKPIELVTLDKIVFGGVHLFSSDVPLFARIHLLTDGRTENEDDSDIGELGDMFQWECPENLRNRLSQAGLQGKRKMSSSDGAGRHGRENFPGDVQNMSLRGSGPSVISSGPTRRDTFRQRKPNTSRPPSMHVDDYVARERNADGTTNSTVIAIPRSGSGSGRPPSIHVDEFMARQRERQNSVGMAAADTASQEKSAPSENETDTEKSNHSRQMKVDLDDDLQGIDIVFDGDESEPDDKLPFPQPDDGVQPATSVIVEQSPQRSIVEETESDAHDLSSKVISNADENTQTELSSRMSASRPEIPLTREPSVSSDKKYFELADGANNSLMAAAAVAFDSASAAKSSGFSSSAYGSTSSLLVQVPTETKMPPPSFYPHNNPQRAGKPPVATSQGMHDQKYLPSQPPLPPTPPPPTISPVRSQLPDASPAPSSPFINTLTDVQAPVPPNYHVQMDHQSTFNNISTSLASSSPMLDSRYPRTLHSSPSGASRPLPPLPPTPPPFPATLFNMPLRPSTQTSTYNQVSNTVTEVLPPSVAMLNDTQSGNLLSSGSRLSYPPPPVMSPSIFNRPSTVPVTLHGNVPAQHQIDNVPTISQNVPAIQPSMPSMQPLSQLQPLQPPQLPYLPQLPQHIRPVIQGSQQAEQGGSLLHSPGQMQLQPQQMPQQSQTSQYHLYYQHQQQENISQLQQHQRVENHQPQVSHQQRDGGPQPQQDSAMSLQQYFSSPEAIQSLLSDRNKLCQLLEQHPKLMQMLQERLGQL